MLGRRASAAVSRGDGSETVAEFAVTHLSDSPRLIGAVVRAPAAEPHAEERLWEQAELLRAAEESAALGTWHWDIAEGVLVWSSEMYAIHGVTEAGFELTPESALALVAPADRPRLDAASTLLVTSGHMPRTEYRVVRPDGVVRWVVSTARRVTSSHGSASRYVGAVRDTSEAHFAEDELRAVHEVAQALADWDTFGEPLTQLLARIGGAFGWTAGALWTPAPTEDRLRCRAFWSAPDANAAAFEAATRKLSLQPGSESLAGRAWSTGWPVGTSSAGGDFAFGRRDAAEEAGLRGGVAFPISADGAVLGSFEFYGREIRPPSERMYRTLSTLGHEHRALSLPPDHRPEALPPVTAGGRGAPARRARVVHPRDRQETGDQPEHGEDALREALLPVVRAGSRRRRGRGLPARSDHLAARARLQVTVAMAPASSTKPPRSVHQSPDTDSSRAQADTVMATPAGIVQVSPSTSIRSARRKLTWPPPARGSRGS